jgi:hypothetical protein
MPASDTSLARSKSACSPAPDGYLQIMMTMSDVDQPDHGSAIIDVSDGG